MKIHISHPVEIALRALNEEDRRRVWDWLDRLKHWENDPYAREHSHKLDASDGVYMMRTSSDLRVFFSVQEDQIVVLDIARKGTIMSFEPLAERARA